MCKIEYGCKVRVTRNSQNEVGNSEVRACRKILAGISSDFPPPKDPRGLACNRSGTHSYGNTPALVGRRRPIMPRRIPDYAAGRGHCCPPRLNSLMPLYAAGQRSQLQLYGNIRWYTWDFSWPHRQAGGARRVVYRAVPRVHTPTLLCVNSTNERTPRASGPAPQLATRWATRLTSACLVSSAG